MTNEEQATKLICDVLSYFQTFMKQYHWRGYALYKILIGSSGMGPEVTIILRDEKSGDFYNHAELQFWLHPKSDEQFVFIYSSLDVETEDIEHESLDMHNVAEANIYFEKAAKLIGLKPVLRMET